MNKDDIKQCTKCGKEFKDENMRAFISLHIDIDRKTLSKLWEPVSNTNINSNELLCADCFDEFTEALIVAMN